MAAWTATVADGLLAHGDARDGRHGDAHGGAFGGAFGGENGGENGGARGGGGGSVNGGARFVHLQRVGLES